jgi:hypothetical protein
MYEPDSYIVEGFNPGMPVINKPPIGLTDEEILCVIAALQSLGGTPTVTLQTTHRYYGGAAAPGGLPAPPAAPDAPGQPQPLPRKGALLRPSVSSPVIVRLVVAHEVAARLDGAARLAEARRGPGGVAR